MTKPKTITAKIFKSQICDLPDDAEIYFGHGDLSFLQVKSRSNNLFQVEFNELYELEDE